MPATLEIYASNTLNFIASEAIEISIDISRWTPHETFKAVEDLYSRLYGRYFLVRALTNRDPNEQPPWSLYEGINGTVEDISNKGFHIVFPPNYFQPKVPLNRGFPRMDIEVSESPLRSAWRSSHTFSVSESSTDADFVDMIKHLISRGEGPNFRVRKIKPKRSPWRSVEVKGDIIVTDDKWDIFKPIGSDSDEFFPVKVGEVSILDAPQVDIPPDDDSVEHPSHYTRGKIEVWDFIIDQGLDYPLGNVVKYVCRAGHKAIAEELEDLKKAQAYLNKKIATLESEQA